MIEQHPAVKIDGFCNQCAENQGYAFGLSFKECFTLQRTETYAFPSQFESFNDIKATLILIWASNKNIMENAVDGLVAPKAWRNVTLKRRAAKYFCN